MIGKPERVGEMDGVAACTLQRCRVPVERLHLCRWWQVAFVISEYSQVGLH